MEECPSMHMVDCMEREKSEVFEDKQNGLQSFKMNCLELFYFWCKQNILVQAEDILDVLDYL